MSPETTGLLDRLRLLLRDRAFMVKAISFACVGVVNTLIDFGVFSLTHLYFGLPIVVANAISWTVAVTGSYVMNSQITFAAESQRKLSLKAYVGFIAAQRLGCEWITRANEKGLTGLAEPESTGDVALPSDLVAGNKLPARGASG